MLFPVKDYDFVSKSGQDAWVYSVLRKIAPGYFIELGSFDGLLESDTLFFERALGWSGLCIESDPKNYNRLVGNRKLTCQALVGDPSLGDVRHFRINRGQTSRVVDSRGFDTIDMHVRLIGDIMKEHHVPNTIDYISLDTEWTELEILRTFPFDDYLVKCWTIEYNTHISGGDDYKEMVCRFMSDRGFLHIKDLRNNGCFLHPVIVESGSR